MTINASRTWVIEEFAKSYEASNIVTLPSNFNGKVQIDATQILNPDTGISSVDTVVDANSGTITIGSLAVSGDLMKATFNVSGFDDGTTYRMVATVTTTDSQTLPLVGTLVGDDNP